MWSCCLDCSVSSSLHALVRFHSGSLFSAVPNNKARNHVNHAKARSDLIASMQHLWVLAQLFNKAREQCRLQLSFSSRWVTELTGANRQQEQLQSTLTLNTR